MRTPDNRFKIALEAGERQYGFWLTLAHADIAEIAALSGYDWVLIDAEHGPQTLQTILSQLRAVDACATCSAVVRTPSSDPVTIRQMLDLGANSLMIPMVETADQAAAIVRAARFPPEGSRGVGGARGSRWGAYAAYLSEANDRLCLIAQIETLAGAANIEAIAAVDGIDGLFIGPADLAASSNLLGASNRETLASLTLDMLRRIRATGKPAGILSRDRALLDAHAEGGSAFIALGIDAFAIGDTARSLLRDFRPAG